MGLVEHKLPDNVFTTQVDGIINWARRSALWPMPFGLACCAIEMMAVLCPRYDMARFGAEVFRATPRQADLMIVSGTVTAPMAERPKRIHDQMPEPKWVIAMGNCAISGGPFVFEGQYGIVEGADKFLPVDIYIPGCPPRPEALIEGILELEEKVTGFRRWPRVEAK